MRHKVCPGETCRTTISESTITMLMSRGRSNCGVTNYVSILISFKIQKAYIFQIVGTIDIYILFYYQFIDGIYCNKIFYTNRSIDSIYTIGKVKSIYVKLSIVIYYNNIYNRYVQIYLYYRFYWIYRWPYQPSWPTLPGGRDEGGYTLPSLKVVGNFPMTDPHFWHFPILMGPHLMTQHDSNDPLFL